MIIVKVIGGLGNQMFQYAFYRSLKSKYSDVKLDISAFETYDLHNGYELNKVFNVKEDIASENEINNLLELPSSRGPLYKLRKKIFKKEKKYFMQKDFGYKLDFLKTDNIYLDGYWQSEKYFSDSEDKILSEFTFKKKLINKNKDIAELINSCNSVSIHIRRGDYITNPEALKVHGGICDLEYYKNSIDIINKKVKNPRFFIFSDDMNWVKNNLYLENASYIDWNKNGDSYIDMQLMSLCKYNVIANSTFSWWGAWLNLNENKIVIAPKKWFNTNANTTDLIPESWIKI